MLTLVHKDYARATTISGFTDRFTHSSSSLDDDYYGSPENLPLPSVPLDVNVTNGSRVNATFVILARNSDLEGMIRTVRSIEDRFNKGYQYPYVFLNDEPFSDDFRRFVQFLSDLLSSI
jgi:alpha 1,2-mannosyltransferase